MLNRLVVSNEKVNGRVLSEDMGWNCLKKKSKKDIRLFPQNFFPLAKVLIIEQ